MRLLFFVALTLSAQPTRLELLRQEAERAKSVSSEKQEEVARPVASMHSRLHDWIDEELHKIETPEIGPLMALEARLTDQLEKAGLAAPSNRDDIEVGYGYADLRFDWLPEAPSSIFVTAGVAAGCGFEEAVYMYTFVAGHWKQILASRPEGFSASRPEISEPDAVGRRLVLLTYMSVQCGSSWMGMVFTAYRLEPDGSAKQLFSDRHSFWLNDGPEFVLTSDDLIVEFLDMSIDSGIHNRTEIQRYRFSEDGVKRLDPVAFQPQDFAEEWLTRPWSEMQERSAPGLADAHQAIHAEFALGEYRLVAPCSSRPGNWVVSFEVSYRDGKELKEPIERYFVVRDLGNYHYRMESVSETAPQGCEAIPGPSTRPSDKHPWLTPDQLRALITVP